MLILKKIMAENNFQNTKSQLKAGAILNYVSIAINMVIGLVYTPYLLRSLGQSEYGLYSLATSLIAYLTVLDLGFGNAIVRYTAKYRAEGKDKEQEKLFGMFWVLYCVIGLAAMIAGSFLAYNADVLFYAKMSTLEVNRTKIMLWLMTFNLAFTFPMSIWGSIMTAYERFVFQRTVSIARSILNPITMVVLLSFGYKAVALVVLTTVLNFLTLFINYLYCKKELKIKVSFGKVEWAFLKEVAIFSFWVFLTAVADKIYWSTGQVILGVFCGAAVIAVFAVGIQLKEMYYLFSSAICGVFLPRITSMISRGASTKEISELFIRTGRIQFMVMSFILTAYIILGKSFVTIWAGPEYEQAYYIALIFFVATTIPLIQNLSISILMAMNRLRKRSVIIVVASICGLLVSIPLFKYGGAIGGALSFALTIIITYGFILNRFYSKDIGLNVLLFWKEILHMSIVPALFCITGQIFQKYIETDNLKTFILYALIFSSLYLPSFYFLSMNKYERDLISKPLYKLTKKNI